MTSWKHQAHYINGRLLVGERIEDTRDQKIIFAVDCESSKEALDLYNGVIKNTYSECELGLWEIGNKLDIKIVPGTGIVKVLDEG